MRGVRQKEVCEPAKTKILEGGNIMNVNIVNEITARQIRTDVPEFKGGDTVKVFVRIIENKKERIQVFEGVVIKRRGEGVGETFTVRKMSGGIGVERTFPVNSPSIQKIEVVKRGRVRRARIYYMRELSGKAARIKEVEKK